MVGVGDASVFTVALLLSVTVRLLTIKIGGCRRKVAEIEIQAELRRGAGQAAAVRYHLDIVQVADCRFILLRHAVILVDGVDTCPRTDGLPVHLPRVSSEDRSSVSGGRPFGSSVIRRRHRLAVRS